MATENGSARIGKSVVIRGEVKGGEDLIIDGRVEGTVTLTESRLTIGPSANIAADLAARDVLIQGQVLGNIVATGRVELRAGCVVEGDVRALRLAVEDNAIFRGKVDLTQGAKTPEPVPATNA
ncbi:MAG: polymer-forming cytoskeletal protein [Terracidiphilus sp.]